MDPRVERIVEFLNDHRIRATYDAVGDLAGVSARSVAALLGGRHPRASWVVAKKDGKPSGYSDNEMHEDLFKNPEVIKTGDELTRRMKKWDPPRR